MNEKLILIGCIVSGAVSGCVGYSAGKLGGMRAGVKIAAFEFKNSMERYFDKRNTLQCLRSCKERRTSDSYYDEQAKRVADKQVEKSNIEAAESAKGVDLVDCTKCELTQTGVLRCAHASDDPKPCNSFFPIDEAPEPDEQCRTCMILKNCHVAYQGLINCPSYVNEITKGLDNG